MEEIKFKKTENLRAFIFVHIRVMQFIYYKKSLQLKPLRGQ